MKCMYYNNKLVAAIFAALLFAVALPAMAETPLPVIPKGQGEECVEPTDVMRVRHFEFILDQRDATMHQGIRTRQHSLAECINCHVPKAKPGEAQVHYGSDEHFCSACHNYAAVNIDCFQCHSDVPTGEPLATGHAARVTEDIDLTAEAIDLAESREEQ